MHRFMILLVLIVLAFASASSVAAQPVPTVPEPGTPADNLCNEGGAWDDGRCDVPPHSGSTNLAWVCGWYMARYYAGTFTAEQVSAECQHHIKVEPVKEVDPCLYAKFAGKNLIGPSARASCCFPFKAVGSVASLGSRSFAC